VVETSKVCSFILVV